MDHVPALSDTPPGEQLGAVVITHVIDLTPAGGGDAKGLAEEAVIPERGEVRDTGQAS